MTLSFKHRLLVLSSVSLLSLTLGTYSYAGVEFVYDSSVPQNQADSLTQDMAYLDDVNFSGIRVALPGGADLVNDTCRMMGIDEMSSSAISGWIDDRIHYVVGEKYDDEKNQSVLPMRSFSYAQPNELATHETPYFDVPEGPGGGGEAVMVMANIGVGYYDAGKHAKQLLALKVAGKDVAITSPRTGILIIGPGLFDPRLLGRVPGVDDPNSAAHHVSRASTLIHESRHSDGNGKSLGFMHAICPQGTNLAGAYACDRTLNGAYTVGARMTQVLAEECRNGKKCSAAETELLRAEYLDSYSRVLTETPAALTTAMELYSMQQKLKQAETRSAFDTLRSQMQKRVADFRKLLSAPSIASVEADARPEGARL